MSKYEYIPTVCYHSFREIAYNIGDYVLAEIYNRENGLVKSVDSYCGEIKEITDDCICVEADEGEDRGASGKFLISGIENLVKVKRHNDFTIRNYDECDGTCQIN